MNQTIENSQNGMGHLTTATHLPGWVTVRWVNQPAIGDRPLKQWVASRVADPGVISSCPYDQPTDKHRRPTAKSYPLGGLTMVAT